jgi:hypothetical protein
VQPLGSFPAFYIYGNSESYLICIKKMKCRTFGGILEVLNTIMLKAARLECKGEVKCFTSTAV